MHGALNPLQQLHTRSAVVLLSLISIITGPTLQHVLEVMREGAQLFIATTEDRLKDVLGRSFQSLTEPTRQIFLDAVSVMDGRNSRAAHQVWDAWWEGAGGAALDELQRRTLVSVDEDGLLRVHDIIRAVGRGIICKPLSTDREGRSHPNSYYGSRAWVQEDGQLVQFEQVCGLGDGAGDRGEGRLSSFIHACRLV